MHSTVDRVRGLLRAAAGAALLLLASLAPATPAAPPRLAPSGGAPPAASEGPAGPRSVPGYRQANRVGIVTIRGAIDSVTRGSVERRIERARADGCDAIVLDLDTPGGEMYAALDLCNLLKDRARVPVNVVAWIHPQAYSAGTIIALACREIVVHPYATFGDAAPIRVAIGTLVQMSDAERAKLEAPLLAEVVDSARRNHYDENLVQSFIAVGIELWMLENVTNGERIFVDRAEYRAVFGDDPPADLAPTAPAPSGRATVRPRVGQLASRDASEDAPWLDAEELRELIEFQQQRPPVRAPLGAESRDAWRLLGQVVSDDRLLTVKTAEAKAYGLAAGTIASDAELRAFFGASTVTRYDRSWSESLVRLLVSWPVRIVLIVILLVAGFIELAAPGTSVFGLVALAALLALIGAPTIAGLAQWWDILLIVLGLVLVAAEIFVIPGFGVAGLLGAACLLVGLVGTFVAGDLSTPAGQDQLWTGLVSVVASLFAGIVGIWLVSRQLHALPIIGKLVLQAEVGRPSGGAGMAGPSRRGRSAATAGPRAGDVGVAVTDLRPSGRVELDGRVVDAQSPARYIERGRPVRVIASGRIIEVEEIEDA